MFVEKLSLFGFKSFNQRVSLDFGPGISGVIGPNGCGKSNIVDAIRWVLGEQSTKQLRGAKMEDVIFNGTREEKPLSLAEVELTLNNDRGMLPVEYGTVSVARRLYRSGVSEYLINKQPVRLRDVRDLFMDTGMGSHAYSVIERQMVDNILSDTTGHRRFLFEEAAGIMKYKTRKREALGKLDATQSDLTRVNDIISEVEREVASLGRQVGKARRHRELLEEIRRLDLGLAGIQREEWRERLAILDAEFAQANRVAETGETEVATLEAKLQALQLRVLEEERRLGEAREALALVDDEIGRRNTRIAVLLERQESARARIRESRDQRVRLGDRQERNVTLGAELVLRREDLARRETEERKHLDTGETALREKEQALQVRRAEVGGAKTHAAARREERIRAEGGLESVARRLAELQERRDEVARRRDELEARAAETAQALRVHALDLAQAQRAVEDEDEAQRHFDLRGQNHESRKEILRRQLAEKRQEAAGVRSRLETLEGLRAAYEGFDAGVRALLVDGERDPGVLGTVGDVVRLPHEWSAALEPVLGRIWQHVVVTSVQTSRHLLGRLREEALGYASFLPLDRVPESAARGGDLVWAADVVETEDRFRPLVRYLLGDLALVPDLEAAFQVVRQGQAPRAATRTGELVDVAVVAGGAGGPSGAELVRREEALARCREDLDLLAGVLGELDGREHELAAERDGLAAEGARLGARLEAARGRRESVEKSEREHALRAQHLSEGLAAEAETARKLGEASLAAAQERERLEGVLEQVTRDSAQAETQLAEREARQGEAEAERDAALAMVHERRMAWARLESELLEARSTGERLEREAADLTAELARCARDEEDAALRIQEMAAELEEIGRAVQELHGEREEKLNVVSAREAEKAAAVAGEQADSEVLREVRREASRARQEAHAAEVALTEIRGNLGHLEERLYQEYEVTGADLDRLEPTELTEDAPAVLAELKDRLKRLGPVNLLAVDDYETKKTRLEFMTTQRDDLQRARESLLKTIEEINRTAAKLFLDTFGVVQENFQKTFQVLFQGGECSLTLVGDDPLEADIDVVARPRGKKPQSINQLSSGERALTAIALLFAIYLVKPSPFCILDEVDAPLDDANIDRFVNMVKEFSRSTQFIVITHNKKTMEAANCLYGITMQRPGVSSVVSVKLDGARRGNGNGSGNGHGEEADGEALAPESSIAQ